MTSPSTTRKSPAESSFCHPGAHEEFDLDTLLRSLAHPCRREVLCLVDAEPEWTIGELAENLGTIDAVPSTVPEGDEELLLYHRHLPLLVEARLIEVDDEFRRISRGENFLPIRAMIDAAVAAMPSE